MPITMNKEEYLSTSEACEFFGKISVQTLRNILERNGDKMKKYRGPVGREVYYKKSELEAVNQMRPEVEEEKKE